MLGLGGIQNVTMFPVVMKDLHSIDGGVVLVTLTAIVTFSAIPVPSTTFFPAFTA